MTLREDHNEGRNCGKGWVNGEFAGRDSDRTANAYKEDNRNKHYGKPAVTYNPGSPNDDGVAQDSLQKWLFGLCVEGHN